MKPRFISMRYYVGSALLLALLLTGCQEKNWGTVAVSPNLEDLTSDSSLYTPSTQSFLRGKHWLESVDAVEIQADHNHIAQLHFNTANEQHFLNITNLPLAYLAPRLNYPAAQPPDAFDAFNLMMAEYSRTTLSVPVGQPGDATAHFETNLVEDAPWHLKSDYHFTANPLIKPIRVGVTNNCLVPGLWEFNASDHSGEIYHSWFNMPEDRYYNLVAQVNGVDASFVAQATQWKTDPVPLDLSRLRTIQEQIGPCDLSIRVDAAAGYSSQDSRRKLAKRYALVEKDGALVKPERLSDLTASVVHMSDFVAPGKYDYYNRKAFDLSFLTKVEQAEVNRVLPLTDYNWRSKPDAAEPRAATYLEITLHLEDAHLVIGNLPMELLVPQEDFVLHGFGVGVLTSDGIAERQKYLIEEGPAPSFAYLYRMEGNQPMALNSHDYGIEQIFIRTHIQDAEPWWEITVTSFERIVDIIKYRISIPTALQDELNTYALEYISPLYRTYRDDNLR